jgi:hypothetical protein
MNQALRIFAVLAFAFLSDSAIAQTLKGTLYKQQQCECCEARADYLRKNGFELEIMSVKGLGGMSIEAGVPAGFQGCHIIKLNGYVFEGHLTSEIIKRFLAERPQDTVGLSIPGMPSGVPGMEGQKDRAITVYAVKKDGTTSTYATQ